jgi:HSP20 family molecular chaperone IbpA
MFEKLQTYRILKTVARRPDLDDPFEDLFGCFNELRLSMGRCVSSDPEKDVFEIELPGVRRDDVDVSRSEKGIVVQWKDRKATKHSLNLLPGFGGCDDVKARLADGILTVTCLRSPKASQKISIE